MQLAVYSVQLSLFYRAYLRETIPTIVGMVFAIIAIITSSTPAFVVIFKRDL